MQENVIVGVGIGLFFFMATAVMTAFAIKYATPSLIWDMILWGGIVGMIMSVVSIALFVSSQLSDRPFWMPLLLLNLGICAIAAALIWHYSPSDKSKSSGLQIGAIVNNAEYPVGTIVNGIDFRPEFTEATISVTNPSEENYEDISLMIQFDEPIAAIAQKSSVPNISFTEKNGIDARIMLSDPTTGKSIVVPSLVLIATDAGYIMRCQHLPANTTISLVVALTDVIASPPRPDLLNLPFEEQVKLKESKMVVTASDGSTYWIGHKDGNVYGPRRAPRWLKAEGRYTASQMTHSISEKIDFSPMIFTGPWKFLDGVMSIQK